MSFENWEKFVAEQIKLKADRDREAKKKQKKGARNGRTGKSNAPGL